MRACVHARVRVRTLAHTCVGVCVCAHVLHYFERRVYNNLFDDLHLGSGSRVRYLVLHFDFRV